MKEKQHVILLVDDNDSIRELLAQVFAKNGYLVKQACNASQAMSLFTPEVDLVITDLDMPDVNGMELTYRLKAKAPVPIAAITGLKFRGPKPFEAVLHKPVLPGVLLKTVKVLLERKELEKDSSSPV